MTIGGPVSFLHLYQSYFKSCKNRCTLKTLLIMSRLNKISLENAYNPTTITPSNIPNPPKRLDESVFVINVETLNIKMIFGIFDKTNGHQSSQIQILRSPLCTGIWFICYHLSEHHIINYVVVLNIFPT